MKVKDYFYSNEEFDVVEDDTGIKKTNPIPQDLSKYYDSENYISHTNNRKTLIEKAYSHIQGLNFNYKLKILNKYSKDGKVLDYGCGNGAFLEYLSKKSEYKLYGYEPQAQVDLQGVKILSDENEMGGDYDIIMLWHVFEHIEKREEVLQILRNKLSKKGVLIIAIPNYSSFDAKWYGAQWAAWDVPRHVYHYSRKGAIKYFTQKEHFYLNKIYPLPFDSFYISMISAKYKNDIIQKAIAPFVGVLSNFFAIFNRDYSSLVYVLKNANEA